MRVAALLLCWLPGLCAAQVPPVLQALRHNDWGLAERLAGADPLAGKLVNFIRLLNASQAGAAELQRFIADNPAWPDGDVLARRYGEALTDEPDDLAAAKLCAARLPAAAPGLLRCAEAWDRQGDPRAKAAARQGWIGLAGSPDLEAEALARWGRVLTDADQAARFDRLEAGDADSAQRQADRLPHDLQTASVARLAFRRRDADAMATLDAVPAALRSDPKLLLAEARYLRRAGANEAALAVWRNALVTSEAAAAPDRRQTFWTERDALARNLLAAGNDSDAYFLADDRLLAPEQASDADFLAGWIALRRLHDPARARAKFEALAAGSRAVITQARAYYWLARAAADPADTRANLALAAAWPTTYYGQLAARAVGQGDEAVAARIAASRDPSATPAQAVSFADSELARAARILVSWADKRRAADFLRQLAQSPATPATRALVAQLALELGLPDVAVQAARLAGRDGSVLAQSGWPAPIRPPASSVPPALVLAVVRQESSFDPAAVSAAGAHGLMQLMPATAAQLARTLNIAAGPLDEPAVNLRLGAAYLGQLVAQFDGTIAYAVAAYDAGPRRVHEWLLANGAPASTGQPEAMVDWIELLPFAETRNYVQRVLENAVVYAARGRELPASDGPG